MQARRAAHRIPGPTSFWEVVAIPPEALWGRKVFSHVAGDSLQTDNKTEAPSGCDATPTRLFSHSKNMKGRAR
jgi:hypothetical protein